MGNYSPSTGMWVSFLAAAFCASRAPAAAAGACDCSAPTSGALAARVTIGWASVFDLNECRVESTMNIVPQWEGVFQEPDGRCGRRAALRLEDLEPDTEQPEPCRRRIRFHRDGATWLSLSSREPGGCLPARLSLELPISIEGASRTLATEGPVALAGESNGAAMPGARLLKGPLPVPLFDTASPGSPPAGFLVELSVELLACDCFPGPTQAPPRRSRLLGRAEVKLFGISTPFAVDIEGRAGLSRGGATPFLEDGALRCADPLEITDLELEGVQLRLGPFRLDASGPLRGALRAVAEGCALEPGRLDGPLRLRIDELQGSLMADPLALEVALLSGPGEPVRARMQLRGGAKAMLFRDGDALRQPVGELRTLDLSLEERLVPACLEGEAEDLAVVAQVALDPGDGSTDTVILDGLLRLERAAPAGGFAAAVEAMPRALELAGHHPRLGPGARVELGLAGGERSGSLSLADPSDCSRIDAVLRFVPLVTVPGRTLRGREPIELRAAAGTFPGAGGGLLLARPVALLDEATGIEAGSISSLTLDSVPRLKAGSGSPIRLGGIGGWPTQVEIPIQHQLELADLEVEMDILHPALGDLKAVLHGPTPGTPGATLFEPGDLAASGLTRLRARFAGQGRPLSPPYSGGTFRPADPGALSSGPIQGGTWTVELSTVNPGAGDLRGLIRDLRAEVIPRGSRERSRPPLPGLSSLPIFCTTLVNWQGAAPGDLRFLRDGRLLDLDLSIGGPQFIDPDSPAPPGPRQYVAVGALPQPRLLGVLESVVQPVPPVEGLIAEEVGGVLTLRWSNPASYDAVRVDLDGDLLELLDGGVTSFQMPARAARGRLLCLTAIRCQSESEPRCRPLLPEAPPVEVRCHLLGAQVQLEVEGVGPYHYLTILRDGIPIALLPGAERGFLDRGFPIIPGRELTYCVRPRYESGRPAEDACCRIRLPQRLEPVCAVLSPRMVEIEVRGAVEDFGHVLVIRDDLFVFDVRDPPYIVRDLEPPSTLEGKGVTYFLTSQYLGVTYPVGSCLAVAAPPARFIRGDCNGDLSVDISDALAVLWTLFAGWSPSCPPACDASGDRGPLDLSDAIHILAYLYLSGPLPPAPFPGCGPGGPETPAGSCQAQCF